MTGTDITSYNAKMLAMAEQASSVEKTTGARALSTSGGILKYDDAPMPGNRVACIIVSSVFANTLYAGRYNPDKIESPRCYAFGESEEGMGPHPSMQKDLSYFLPQSPLCHTCEHNEWGSAEQGRGKRCQQRRSLAVIPAGQYVLGQDRQFHLQLYNNPDIYRTADFATLKIPVTSVKGWSKYVKGLARDFQRPPLGMITDISLVPDAGDQFHVQFEAIETVPDDHLEAVFSRSQEALEILTEGYEPPGPDDGPQGRAANPGASQIKGLR